MKRIGKQLFAPVFCCCLTLSLAACGQRGPLYLPDSEEQSEPTETVTGAEETSGNNTEESDEETP